MSDLPSEVDVLIVGMGPVGAALAQLLGRYGTRTLVIDKAKEFITSGDWASGLFGGVVGIGVAVLGFLANAFVVTVLTLYFLASLPKMSARPTPWSPPAAATASSS